LVLDVEALHLLRNLTSEVLDIHVHAVERGQLVFAYDLNSSLCLVNLMGCQQTSQAKNADIYGETLLRNAMHGEEIPTTLLGVAGLTLVKHK